MPNSRIAQVPMIVADMARLLVDLTTYGLSWPRLRSYSGSCGEAVQRPWRFWHFPPPIVG